MPPRRERAPRAPLMSRARTIEELRALGRDGRVVRHHELPHPLFLAMRVHFGTIAAARRAVGIAAMPRKRTWSARRVISELRALDREGVRMVVGAILEAGSDGLVYALYKYLGTIDRARRLAGIKKPRRIRYDDPWTEDRVIEEIQALHGAGHSVAMNRVDPRMVGAGQRLFGSWREAIEAAGLDYATVRLVREAYTRKEVVVLLRKLAKRQPRMTLSEANIHPHGRAARKVFGSVTRALQAAKLTRWPLRLHQLPMPKAEIIKQLRARARAGKPVYDGAVLDAAPRLRRSALAHWGRWPRVLAAARLRDDAPVRRRWSKAIVLAHLRARKKRGQTLRPGLVAKEDASLVVAASTYFGSYRAAAKLVGFDSSRKPWTRQRVIDELRRKAKRGKRVTNAQAGPALTLAAWKLFGKFSNACRAAGLEVHAKKRKRPRR